MRGRLVRAEGATGFPQGCSSDANHQQRTEDRWQLRYLLGFDRKLCATVLQVIVSELLRSYKRRAKQHLGLSSIVLAQPGAVTFVQRFDSALRLSVHAHAIVLAGVYTPSGVTPHRVSPPVGYREARRVLRDAGSGELCFHALPEPTQADVQEVARRIAARIEEVLRKGGRWLEDEQDGASLTAENVDLQDAVLSSCYQAAAAGQELLGERVGQPTLRLVGLPPGRPRKRNIGSWPKCEVSTSTQTARSMAVTVSS